MCPLGCEVILKANDAGNVIEITGNKCKKGEKYVQDEFSHPVRALTTTVAVDGANIRRLSVRTSDYIPKDRIFDCMREIQKKKVKAPVKIGDVIIKDLLGLGVDVVATRDLSVP
jgi:CxxC motif-containing protein